MSILEEMLEMFTTTVQAELNATLHVCESGLQDVLTNRSNFTSNVVFQFLYGAWLVNKWFTNLFGEDDEDEPWNGYFQQDGATCNTSNESMAEIESFSDDRIILKASWPPRSPDLSPPNFFLWGALKGKAYANKPRTIQELENNIRREIAAISEHALQATFANMKRQVQLCLDSGGEHFQHLL